MTKQRPHPRLAPGEEDFPYDLDTLLDSQYHMDARKPIDRLLRYERVLSNKTEWIPLNFNVQTVVEIGSGPLFGWGPIAVYLGATRYVCIEPKFRQEVIDSDEIWVRFFLPLHQQLEAIFGHDVEYVEFAQRIRSRIEVQTLMMEECRLPEDYADLMISNGVLQHAVDLDLAVTQIARISRPDTRQFHVLNFTDHFSDPNDPFRKIYRLTPEEYFERDSLLNLKRPSDVLRSFQEAGCPVTIVPYFTDQHIENRKMVDYWKRYDISDLAIQIAFFVN